MENDILPHCNLYVRTLYERYVKLVDSETAFIMACAEGGQPEMAAPVLEMKKQDQMILEQETYRCLVPRQELYSDFEVIPQLTNNEDAVNKKNDDE